MMMMLMVLSCTPLQYDDGDVVVIEVEPGVTSKSDEYVILCIDQ